MSTKNDILSIPLQELTSLDTTEVQDFIKLNKLSIRAGWFLPQLISEINTWKLVRSTEDGNKYDGLETLKLNTLSGNEFQDSRNRGIWYLCKYKNRGELLPETQTKPEYVNYSRLVPLILYAFKLYRNIPYSSWVNIATLVENSLYEAMTCTYDPIPRDVLLQLQRDGLTVRTGPKAGQLRDPRTAYDLYNIRDSEIAKLPTLAKMMLCQTWCAHPSNRTEYMILDPKDWDNMPEPLVSTEIIRSDTPRIKKAKQNDVNLHDIPPWEM